MPIEQLQKQVDAYEKKVLDEYRSRALRLAQAKYYQKQLG